MMIATSAQSKAAGSEEHLPATREPWRLEGRLQVGRRHQIGFLGLIVTVLIRQNGRVE